MNEQLTLEPHLLPRARTTDPITAQEAAESVKPANGELVAAIRRHVYMYGPLSAFEIADALEGRWQHDTIRSAVSRAGLSKCDFWGVTPGGRRCTLYVLRVQEMASL